MSDGAYGPDRVNALKDEVDRLREEEKNWHVLRDGEIAELKRLLSESEEDNVRLRRDPLRMQIVEREEHVDRLTRERDEALARLQRWTELMVYCSLGEDCPCEVCDEISATLALLDRRNNK